MTTSTAGPRLTLLGGLALTMACASPVSAPSADGSSGQKDGVAVDDGSYLGRIDPLGGQWRVGQVGPRNLAPYRAWVNLSEGGFLNHGAGCSGGYPAFYRLDGNRVTVTRLEKAAVGRCASAPAGTRTAAIESERLLTAFLDKAASWKRVGDRTLVLTGSDGTRAVLTRPAEPHPELAGRWLIETIGGRPLRTEKRPGTLSIELGHIGAFADCNSMGASFIVPSPGRIAVNGPIVSTAIGCMPEDAAEDELITSALMSARSYRVEGQSLRIDGKPGMALRRPPAPDRRLVGEYSHCGNTVLGAYHEGPVSLTIDDQVMRDNAGCTARYIADGPQLSISLAKDQACASTAPPFEAGKPVGIGGTISTLAVARPEGFGFDEQGRLVLSTRRGLLPMCRNGSPKPFGS